MNKGWNWLKDKRDIVLLAGMLVAFVGGLYGIGSLFGIVSAKPRLVVLPESRVGGALALAPEPDSSFRLESASKQQNDFPMFDFRVAEQNAIFLNRFRASYSGVKLSMLYMDDNHVKDIATNTDFGMALSPDGTKVVYSRYDERNKPQLYAYDWKKGTHRKLKDDHAYWREFIGDDVYVAYDDDQYKKVDLTTGDQDSIITHDELSSRVSRLAGNTASKDVLTMPESVAVSKDRRFFYVTVQYGENKEGIYRMSLKDGEQDELLAKTEYIQEFSVLNNGSIVMLGEVNGTHGLYLYKPENKEFKLLHKGDIYGFGMDEDRSRIAYLDVLDNQEGQNELHVAYLKNGALSSDTVIYRNIQDFYKLLWSGDSLFVGGSSMDISEIYRFTFRVW
ncbi:hypothetical protein [Paenibacillus sp. JJ-223]|uniref:hypothetical protein n=1 Tax=Paenibacillus sp. JJ-223 TaxID=2905647 RepID=UPI001F26F78B|nr:hypothetical protein [Paenibacillus sp. JJ-223]CAH1219257.1 hypothetical protein PAECIP111890_04886 [Paenibacillus sp. JJ-223]